MLGALKADRDRILEIRDRISELEQTIAALRDEQEAAQQRLDSYKYPVLTLPNEITSEIFIHFLGLPASEPPEIHSPHSPIRLTHICRKWRAVAIATPPLWKGLRVLVHPSRRELKGLPTLADMWLQRSGCCPLSIEFIGSIGKCGDELLSTFLSYSKRLQNLKLGLLPPRILPQIDSPMVLLRSLEFDFVGDSQVNELASWDMPELRTVALRGAESLEMVLPWEQLTSLSFHRIDPQICLPVLRKTPSLLFCTLDFNFGGYAYRPYTGSGIINLPALTSLVIQTHRREFFSTRILTDLVVPALQQLEVPESSLGEKPIDLLTSFISKSGCTPRKLFITDRKILVDGSNVTDQHYRSAFPSVVDFSSTIAPAHWDDSDAEDLDIEEFEGFGSESE
ncbi:F-box domain-containing protein [Favolaschia claudopus]|uniref:F-box domain-containing protein n=1 Tax=Favolaschia claudopus TaxID=2862362 RepID=A0AAW0CB27_9AGAR